MTEKITMLPIASLVHVEADKNPNVMSVEDFNSLITTIKTTGFNQPILVTKQADGRHKIIDGHHRVEALNALGRDKVPAVVAPAMTDAQESLLRIAMNRIRGSINATVVREIFAELLSDGSDIQLLTYAGYSEAQILAMTTAEMKLTPDMAGTSVPSVEGAVVGAAKPHMLEIVFATLDELKLAKRKLLKASGAAKDLGVGLLAVLGEDGKKPVPKQE